MRRSFERILIATQGTESDFMKGWRELHLLDTLPRLQPWHRAHPAKAVPDV